MVTCKGDVCTFSTVCGDADQVFLIGDFNDWSTTAHAMRRADGNLWRADLRLRPGTYRFAYFVIHSRRCRRADPGTGLTALRADARGHTISVPNVNNVN
jgi:1,4-alpha-glucan branching enzyme